VLQISFEDNPEFSLEAVGAEEEGMQELQATQWDARIHCSALKLEMATRPRISFFC